MSIEDALGKIAFGIETHDFARIGAGIGVMTDLRDNLLICQIERAIDLIRNTPDKEKLFHQKQHLTLLLLRHYGDDRRCVVRYDRKYNMARVTWVNLLRNTKWSCHIPGDLLEGRFREMMLGSR
jgi:hypothetical protein